MKGQRFVREVMESKQRILARMKGSIKSSYKIDGSIVTELDVEIETLIKAYVQKHFPSHDFAGEETQAQPGDVVYAQEEVAPEAAVEQAEAAPETVKTEE